MASNSGATGSGEEMLRQRNVTDPQQEVEARDDPMPTQKDRKEKKTIGRTPDGVGEYSITS